MTKEEKKERNKKYREANKERISLSNKAYREKNKEKISERLKKYNKINKEKIAKKRQEYKEANVEKIALSNKAYREKNKDKKNKQDRNRRANDPYFKLRGNLSCIIRQSLKTSGYLKKDKTIKVLGCSFKEFRIHIEKQFEPWMTWFNYGSYILNGERTWNIDHIIPVSSSKTEDGIVKLNHFSNLRPLCSKENNQKSNKFI